MKPTNVKKVIRLLKVHGKDPDDCSPNFVADFARNHNIQLTSPEIVEISDSFASNHNPDFVQDLGEIDSDNFCQQNNI